MWRLLRPEVGPHRYGEARSGDGRLASGQPRSATHDVVSFDGGPDAIKKKPADAAADTIDAVRAVADVSVHAIRRRRADAVANMGVLTYITALLRSASRECSP